MTKTSCRNGSGKNFENLVGQIVQTVTELEKSVRSSQALERKQFQNELQLHIDKHQLSLSLDQQKYHNKRLTRLAMSLSDSSSAGGARTKAGAKNEDARSLREKCAELKNILGKREMQLRKTRATLKQVTEDNVKLAKAYESKSAALKELSEKHEALKKELRSKSVPLGDRESLNERGSLKESGSPCGGGAPCEHEAALAEIQMFYEGQLAELAARLEEQQLITGCLEEQQLRLAEEQSLAEYEKTESKKSESRRNEILNHEKHRNSEHKNLKMSGRKFIYFAYDNLMLSTRMLCCVQRNAKRVGLGKLANHRLMFGDFSPDWYGTMPTIKKKCECVVWGSLWELDDCFRAKLDEVQGVKKGLYIPVTVQISSLNVKGGTFPALTHKLKKDPPEPELFEGIWRKKFRPSKLYHEELLDGAEESCLPVYYRKWLMQIPHNGFTGSVLPDLKDDREYH
ncbi:hypothetical protein GE061_006140 [Apolygus lucorum]|uniref:gamma-glutamylcyclotransferase n=1 Tax=Apolygus lucorum TaxID=248454 RepID=A0A6A4J768_APOLU|nr:hypothetical protein GE061_006140 [Apolygus lucorum]